MSRGTTVSLLESSIRPARHQPDHAPTPGFSINHGIGPACAVDTIDAQSSVIVDFPTSDSPSKIDSFPRGRPFPQPPDRRWRDLSEALRHTKFPFFAGHTFTVTGILCVPTVFGAPRRAAERARVGRVVMTGSVSAVRFGPNLFQSFQARLFDGVLDSRPKSNSSKIAPLSPSATRAL